MTARLFSFVGGAAGAWRVTSASTRVGHALADVSRLDVVTGGVPRNGASWALRGLTSNER